MKCKQAQKHFETLYRQVSDRECYEAAEHLKGCSTCTAAFAQWKNIAQCLERSPAVPAPGQLSQDILREIRLHDAPHTPWTPFLAPAPLLRPALYAGAISLAATSAVFIYQISRHTAAPQALAATEVKAITFALDAPKAHSVAIAGDFNQWDTRRNVLSKDSQGRWSVTLQLAAGSAYEYQFVVDNSQWSPDPKNPAWADDGFGGRNSEIEL